MFRREKNFRLGVTSSTMSTDEEEADAKSSRFSRLNRILLRRKEGRTETKLNKLLQKPWVLYDPSSIELCLGA